ncbi:Gut granule LOss [Caenorhabditis elegans]|uniref:GLO-3 n=1 Tax=Caenorhabditis elegans TaxID=6239 RepID=G5EBW0_CAEEL|nr:Gut granule LOss [Caenorhabditis elegans]ACH87166.1 GLO-3 [Caenorhabditis elegans]CAR81374.1 Gut granule LOss [Caenorhabditis elegans]|eukprot:NP_001257108.1 Gut granule LOss [Caenorhabditis elegans]
MFGYVVVNEQNSIVFLDGNEEFKTIFQSLIQSEITSRKSDLDSASSGVGSSTCTEEQESSLDHFKKPNVVFNSSEISHILLPLILLYRSTSEKTKDPITEMSSQFGTISISKFYHNYLVLVFANDDRKRIEVSQTIEHTIATLFGPLIAFCHTDLTTVKKPKEHLACALTRKLSYSPKSFIDIRRKLFYFDKIAKLKDTFHKISSQLNVFVDNNRCLLLSKGDIIATYNSVEGNDDVLKGLNTNDLLNIVSNTSKCDANTKIEQFWLRSTTGLIPYYVNVISATVFKNMTLVCLVESSENTLIRYLYLFSKQLDQLRISQDLNRDLKEVRKTINDIHILLLSRKPLPDTYCAAFMRNPLRASSFFKSIWNQIETEVLQINRHSATPTQKPRSESRFSISSWRSALSTMSLSSSVFTRITMDDKTMTQKMDILLSYGKKQINSLIQELCSISIANAKLSTLPLFNQCLEKTVKPNSVKAVDSLGIGSKEQEDKLEKFLKPSEFFLEMYAYRIQFDDLKQEITYISDEYKENVNWIRQLKSANRFSCDYLRNSGEKFMIFHFNLPNLNQKSTECRSNIRMTAVFPEYMNKNLAEKQTNKLLECVLKQLK